MLYYKVDRAFRMLTEKKSRERWGVDDNQDVKEQDIKVRYYSIKFI